MSNVNPVGHSPQPPLYLNSPLFQSLDFPVRDTLTQSLSIEELNALFVRNAPNLPLPSISIGDFFETLSAATLKFQNQLSSSAITEDSKRRQMFHAAASQAQTLTELFNERQLAIETITQQTQTEITQLEDLVHQIKSETDDLQQHTDIVNNGNNNEQLATDQQVQNYNAFIEAIESQLGAIRNSDGTYTIPPGQNDQETADRINTYNTLAAQYGMRVQQFNLYTSSRRQTIDDYNTLAGTYNANGIAHNQQIINLINRYGLSDYLAENHIPSMLQPTAPLRDTSLMTDNPMPTMNITGLPASVSVGPPPSWVTASANQPPQISGISYTGLTENQLNTIQQGIYDSLYQQYVVVLDVVYEINLRFWSFLLLSSVLEVLHRVDKESSSNLDFKPLRKKVLPDSLVDIDSPVSTHLRTGASSMAIQIIGLGTSHLAGLLSQILLAQTVTNILSDLDKKSRDELVDQLQLFTVNLLGANALQSILPSLGPLTNSLNSLPQDSPIFSLLFSISFINRIQESIQQNLIAPALETLLAETPFFANLKDDDQANLIAQLTSALHVTLLLISVKLLTSNLGLPTLPTQLLSLLLPPNLLNPEQIDGLVASGLQEKTQIQADLRAQVEQFFLAQDFSAEEAGFLADVGVDLAAYGPLAPLATSISEDEVNVPLLQDSVKAGLVLSGIRLDQANQIAESALRQTLAEGPFKSRDQFISVLEGHLRSVLGPGHNTLEIASQAILFPREIAAIPPPPPPLSTTTSTVTSTTSTDVEPPASNLQLSADQLVALLDTRVEQLVPPQLGPKFTEFVREELIKSFFGTTTPTAPLSPPNAEASPGNIQSPFSAIRIMQHEIVNLIEGQNEEHLSALTNSFREFMKDSIQLDKFLEKVMDPANLFIYSIFSGIMYGGHEPNNWKKFTDLPV